MKRLLLVSSVLGAFAATAAAATTPEYRLVKTVVLGAPERWDYVTFDPAQDRVYVAHSTQMDVIDGSTGRIIGRIPDIAGAHGVATAPSLGRGYADDGKTGSVTIFDLATLKTLGTIPADNDSDAMIYDPVTRLLVVANGDAHDASIIDVATSKRLANVPLGGSPEAMVVDGRGNVFINVASANQIVRLNLRKRSVDARWPTVGCESPHGLAIDRVTARLFISCENAQMLVLNAADGRSLALLPIGHGTDSAGFDPVRKRAFSSNGDGTLSVIAEKSPNAFVALGNVTTAPGARTMAVDPKTGRVFLVTATVTSQQPPDRPGGHPHYVFAPGSVKLLILDPVTR